MCLGLRGAPATRVAFGEILQDVFYMQSVPGTVAFKRALTGVSGPGLGFRAESLITLWPSQG